MLNYQDHLKTESKYDRSYLKTEPRLKTEPQSPTPLSPPPPPEVHLSYLGLIPVKHQPADIDTVGISVLPEVELPTEDLDTSDLYTLNVNQISDVISQPLDQYQLPSADFTYFENPFQNPFQSPISDWSSMELGFDALLDD